MNKDEQIKNKKNHKKEETESIEKVELDKLKAQLIRVNADFDNFKKRVTKERAEWEDFARSNIVEEFLPIFDDFDRAVLEIKKEYKDTKSPVLDGLELVQKNLNKILKNLDIKEIDCSIDFDPELHEALIQVENNDLKSGQIAQVFNKGYTFNDRVIRHAKVSVAK